MGAYTVAGVGKFAGLGLKVLTDDLSPTDGRQGQGTGDPGIGRRPGPRRVARQRHADREGRQLRLHHRLPGRQPWHVDPAAHGPTAPPTVTTLGCTSPAAASTPCWCSTARTGSSSSCAPTPAAAQTPPMAPSRPAAGGGLHRERRDAVADHGRGRRCRPRGAASSSALRVRGVGGQPAAVSPEDRFVGVARPPQGLDPEPPRRVVNLAKPRAPDDGGVPIASPDPPSVGPLPYMERPTAVVPVPPDGDRPPHYARTAEHRRRFRRAVLRRFEVAVWVSAVAVAVTMVVLRHHRNPPGRDPGGLADGTRRPSRRRRRATPRSGASSNHAPSRH